MLLSVYADVIATEDSTVAVEEVPPAAGGGGPLYSLLLLMPGGTFRLDGLSRAVLAGLGEQIARALGARKEAPGG